jgi:uncharacterized protein (TIGR02118 family)
MLLAAAPDQGDAMHRVMFFLKRRADLDRPSFFRWWLEQHRPIARELPGLRRYIISHAIDAEETPFDGVGELWFDNAAAEQAAFASPQGQKARADRQAHTARNERLQVVEHPFVDTGARPRFKLVAGLKRRPDLTRADFKRWWLERHAPLVVKFPELSRYQVNLVEHGEETFADGVAEVCFNDRDALIRVMTSTQVKDVQKDSAVHAIGVYRMFAEEHRMI